MEKEEIKKEEVKKENNEKESKKGLILALIFICILLLAGIGVCLFIIFKPGNKPKPVIDGTSITITFDSDGGLEVDKLTFKKGTEVELPTSTKDGFEFGGWFNGETEFTKEDTPKLEKDILLKAKWNELTSEESLMTINFDSKGGNKISSIQVKCINNSTEITNLPTPKREGYNFMSWADKNGTPILNGALLICDEKLDLYANWEKKDGEKWTCESGDGPDANHKCKQYMTPDKKCPSNTVEKKGVCIDPNNITASSASAYKSKIVRTCGKSTVIMDNNGHTQEVQGTLAYVGDSWETAQYYYCAYGATSESQYECTSTGHKWISVLNKCYRSKGNPGENISYSCSQGDLVYLSTNEVNSIRQNANINGCFKTTNKESYCSDSSYTLEGEYCIKYTDAKKTN